jgi:hypothetical protein
MDKEFALALKDIKFLIAELLDSKDAQPFEVENSLADSINALENHRAKIEADESLKNIYSTLKFIEKIHRDILVAYKKLSEDLEIVKEIETQAIEAKKAQEEKEKSEKEEEEKKEQKKEEAQETRVEKEKKPEEQIKKVEEVKVLEQAPVQAISAKAIQINQVEAAKEQGILDYAAISKKLSELANLPEKENFMNGLIDKNEEDLTIKYLVAVEYHKLGNMEKAQKLYREILEKRKDDKRVLYSLASLLNQQKKQKESYELYAKLMVIAPEYMNTKKYFEALDQIYGTKQLEKSK